MERETCHVNEELVDAMPQMRIVDPRTGACLTVGVPGSAADAWVGPGADGVRRVAGVVRRMANLVAPSFIHVDLQDIANVLGKSDVDALHLARGEAEDMETLCMRVSAMVHDTLTGGFEADGALMQISGPESTTLHGAYCLSEAVRTVLPHGAPFVWGMEVGAQCARTCVDILLAARRAERPRPEENDHASA